MPSYSLGFMSRSCSRGLQIKVLVVHRNRDVRGDLPLLDSGQEGVPVAGDLGPGAREVSPSRKKGRSLGTEPSELCTGAENSNVMSLAGPCPTFWTMGRFA